ncbi:DUF4388 domain-containing protein [bacterium]|nr:DUF4388 domain-containing protein [candidate division CSSED10-310 bacterium]
MAERNFETTTEDLSIPEIFGMIAAHEVTGTLTIITGNVVRKVYFEDGNIAFASSSSTSDQLDSVLTRLGRLDPKKHASLIKKLRKDGFNSANLLLKENLITPEEVIWLVRFQILIILYGLLSNRNSKAEFLFGEHDDSGVLRLNIQCIDLLFDAIRYHFTDAQIDEYLDELNRPMARTDHYDQIIKLISTSPSEYVLLKLLDEPITIARLTELSPFAPNVTRRLALAFYFLRLIEPVNTKKRDA